MNSKFRLTSVISTTSSPQMLKAIDALHSLNSKSETVREAMTLHAHKAKSLRVPPEFQPPKEYADRAFISTVVTAEVKRDYEIYASRYGIPLSQLVLRCLSAYVVRNSPPPNPNSLTPDPQTLT